MAIGKQRYESLLISSFALASNLVVKNWSSPTETDTSNSTYLLTTTMPPLKVKTNLSNARSAAAPYDVALKKNQLKARKESKVAKPTQNKAKMTDTVPKAKELAKVKASSKKVEVEILVRDVDVEIDELLEDEERARYGKGDHLTPRGSTVQEFHQHHSQLASNATRLETPISDTGYWSGNEHAAPHDDNEESLNSLLDDLLKPKTDQSVAALKRVIEKVPTKDEREAASKLEEATSSTSALGKLGGKRVKSNETVSVHQASKDSTFPGEEFISSEHFNLAHTVVIKVLEHALNKNVDWFTMAKELESAGLTNVKKSKAATGRGKGKNKAVGAQDELESEEVSSKLEKMPKVDGNFLCEYSFNSPIVSWFRVRANRYPLYHCIDDMFHYVSLLTIHLC